MISTIVEQFIKDNINLIDGNKFQQLYNLATRDWQFPHNVFVRELTETLINAEIPFLEYMSFIPSSFLWESSIEEIELPNNILNIDKDAFYGSALTQITIPENCISIGQDAFAMCKKLNKLTLLNADCNIDIEAFSGGTPIQQISYNGIFDQWKYNYKDLLLPHRVILYCLDRKVLLP